MQNDSRKTGGLADVSGRLICTGPSGTGKSAIFQDIAKILIADSQSSAQPATSFDPFSQDAKSVFNGNLLASEQDFHERLVAQLQRDADEIRKTCAVVRDPKAPRTVEYKTGDALMAVTRSLCMGK